MIRWEWGKNLHDLRPLYQERARLTRVGPLAAPPPSPAGYTRYGFDAAGHLVRAERHHPFDRVDVDTWAHTADAITGTHRTHAGLETRSRFTRVDGRVMDWTWETLAGPVHERYEWSDALPHRVWTRGPNDPPRTWEATWGPEGLLRLTSALEGTGRTVVVWERENRPVEDLAAEVLDLLTQAVLERLAAVAWEEPAWALLLVKCTGYDALPPELVVGVGRRWLGEAGRELPVLQARDERSLGGGEDPLSLHTPALVAACRRLEHRARAAGSPAPLHAVLDDLAARLLSGPLPLPREPDFAVVVVDLDEGLSSAALAQLPPATAQRLRRSGLAP